MIQLILVCGMLTLSPSSIIADSVDEQSAGDQEIEPMAIEVAHARISDAINKEYPLGDRVAILSEVYSRCDDPHYRAIAAYNLGALMIRERAQSTSILEDAIGWLQQADSIGISPSQRANARYNIGHARYILAHAQSSDAIQDSPSVDLESTKRRLQLTVDGLIISAGAFRAVHELDPDHTQAIENLERVRLEIRDLREQIHALEELIEQEQNQLQQQQQQAQQASERLRDLAQQQQQEAEQNASGTPTDIEQQQSDQSELSEQTQQEQDQISEQFDEQSEPLRSAQEQIRRARDAQDRAEQALEEGDPESASEHQQEAAQAMQEAAEMLEQLAQQQSQQQGEQGQQGNQSEEHLSGSDEQPEPEDTRGDEISEIARMLLDKERREREARRSYRPTGRPVRVEKDW